MKNIREMKFFNKLFLLSIILITFFALASDSVNIFAERSGDLTVKGIWGTTFGSSGSEQYEAIQMNVDGTYVVAGSTDGNNYDVAGRNHGQVDGILSKYNKDGQLIWSKIVGGSGEDYFSELKVLKDGKIAAAGYTESSKSGDVTETKYGYDSSWIVVYDQDGNKLWSSVNGRSGDWGYAAFRGITETSDGNIVCVGYAFGPGDGNIPGTIKGERDTFIIKFDAETGNRLWYKFNGGSSNETFYDVMELNNGNLVGVGQTQSNDGDFAGKNKGGYDAMAIVYDKDGVFQLSTTFGGSKDDNFVAVKKSVDNKIVLAGNTFSKDGDINTMTFEGRDGMFVVMSNTGEYEWQKIVGGNGDDYLTYMTEGLDGDFSVVGYTNSTTSGALELENKGGYDGLFTVLAKENGDIKHIVLYGGTQDDMTETIAATDDAGYVVAGHSRSSDFEGLAIVNRGLRDGFVGKFKTNNVPLLEAPDFTEITVGQDYDLLTGVTVTDYEDGDLINHVEVVTEFNKDVPGVYPVVYNVEDFEHNKVSISGVILVNDGKYKAGSEHIIYADDYTIYRGQVVLDKTDVETRAKVKVYSKDTGLPMDDNSDVAVDYGLYKNEIGIYDLVFNLVSEPTTTIISKANVIKGIDPQLTIREYFEMDMNGDFDPKTNLSAYDEEDKDITNKVVIENNVDTSIPGIYEVNYSITDSDYNTVTKTQYVVVRGEGVVIGKDYNIEAHDYQLYVSQVNGSDDEIISQSSLKVFDKTKMEFVVIPDVTIEKNGYTNIADLYNIKIIVNAEPTLFINIQADIIAGTKPNLEAPAFTEIALNSLFNEMNGVKVSDVEDDDVELLGKVTSESTPVLDTSKPGFYTIVYSVMDNDKNTDTATRVVLVNDGSYVVDPVNNLIVQAKDFEKFVSEVDTADAAIIEDGQVKVFDKTGLDVTAANTVTVDKGTYTNVAGKYNITYTVTGGPAITIEATVNAGEKPDLTVPTFTEININTPFNKMSGVSVTDNEDDDVELLGKVTSVSTPEVDITKPGFYTIVYSVMDNDNNTDTATRVLLVNDGSYVVDRTSNLIIQAKGFEKFVSEVDTADAAIIEAGQVKVFDKTGVDVTDANTVTVDKGTYTNVAGKYNITYTVTGGPAITIEATVNAGEKPDLTVPAFTEININTTFNKMSGVSVTDIEDDDVELLGKVTSVSTPEVDITKPGFYTIVYSVMDNDNNTDTATRVLLVNDGSYVVDPVNNLIIQAKDFEKFVSEVDTADTAIIEDGQVKVFDKTGVDVTDANTVTVDKGTYTNVAGKYNITYTVTDGPAITIEATVNAGEKPDLTVPAFTEININTPFNKMSGVSVTDNEDDDVELLGKVTSISTPEVDITKPGFYTIVYSVMDNDNNTDTATRVLLVNDGSYVVDPVNNLIIQAKDFEKFVSEVDTADAAIIEDGQVKVFDKTGADVTTANTVTVDKGTYTNVAGKYNITYTVTDGPAITIEATVNAGEKPDLTVPAFTEINVNTPFNKMSGVSVTDNEDDDVELLGKVTSVSTPEVDITKPGFYTIVYNVVDNDNNTDTATRVLLVNDGSYVVDPVNNLIIQAKGFEKYVSEVDTADAAIIEDGQVKVFDKTGIDVTAANTVTVDKGTYTNVAGKYNITYTVTDGPAITIEATVNAGEKPDLTVPAFSEITINSSFNKMSGVSVTDTEDDDVELLGKVTSVSTPEVDITKPGFYTIVYNVVDNDNNTDTATRILLVNDGSYVVDPVNNLIIQAKDFEKFVSEVDTADAAIIEAGQVKVFDKTGVDVTAANTVTVDKGTYTNVAGKYNITFSVTDGPAITIEATVNAGEKPDLTVPAFTEINVNTPFNKMSGVSVTDNEDDDVELLGKVTSVSTPEVDITKPGFYTIVYSVMDNDNNTDTATRVLLVNDGSYVVDPVNNLIVQAKDFEKYVSEVDTADAAIIEDGQVKVFDKTGVDVTAANTVTIDKGTYTNVAGKYNITFSVTDGPAITIEATVNAGEKPDLTVPAFTEINVNTPFNKMSGVSVTDNEDDDVELLGKVTSVSTPEVDITKPGFYTIVYSVMDNDNNTDTATRVLLVNDGSYVVDPVNNLIIQAKGFEKYVSEVDTADEAITEAGQVKVFDKTGIDVTTANTVTVDKGTYTNVAGKYNITYTVTDGPAITIEATVNAGEKPDLTVPAFSEITINSSFNKMSGVSVTDNEDDDVELLGKVTAESTPVLDTSKPGFYTIVYNVMDNDNNTDTATRVLLVNDGNYVVDNESNLIIHALDFTKFVGQVDISDTAIKKDAAVKVYDKTSADVTSTNLITVDKGDYKAIEGNYEITFSLETGKSITILASVVGGDVPVLKVPEFTEVAINFDFDEMKNVEVSDKEDDIAGLVVDVSVTPENLDTSVPGFKTIEYLAIDSDGNEIQARQIVLVNDGSYVVDPVNNLIIQAQDFMKYVSEVDTADAAIIEDGQVKVFDKTGTDVIATNTVTVDKGTYTNVAGKYDITFTVTDGPAITIEATVSAGEKPDLTVPAFTEININTPFNKMSGVSVTDNEDDDVELLGKVTSVSTPEVDITKPGFYTIVYNVIDNDNNTDTATRVLLVNDGSYVVDPTSNLIIQAKDFEKFVSEVDTADTAIIEDGQVKVFNKTGVDVTATNTVTVDKGTYTNVAGKYNITYTVTDGPEITIEATVNAGEKPDLTVPAFSEITLNSSFNTMSGVSVTDIEDDDVELLGKVTAESTPLLDTSKPGFYTIVYSVVDNDNNTDTATRVVLVNDGSYVVDPVNNLIVQAKDFEKFVSEVDTADAAINEDGQVKVFDKTGVDVTAANTVTVDKGTYTNVAGKYNITFNVTDGPAITIEATVNAGEKPDLTVPAFTEININTPFNKMSGVSVTDIEDDDVELLGKVTSVSTPEVDITKPGFYTIVYSVMDNDNNTDTATRVVLVNDGSYVVDRTSNLIIQAKGFEKFVSEVDTADAAIIENGQVKVFDKTGVDVTDANTVTVDKGTYTNVAGKYNITYTVTGGPSITIEATVNAGEKPDLTVPAFTEINVNTPFNKMSGVSVTDNEDDDVELLGKVTSVSTPEVDITKPGFYTIVYNVVDNDNNTDTATRVLLVNDGSYVLDPVNNLIIQAKDFEKFVSEVDTADAAIIEAGQVKVFDKTGLDVTATNTVTVDKGTYTNVAGKYNITYTVTDGPAITIEATVNAGEKPDLTVPTFTEISINTPFNKMSGVSVTDNEDDDVELLGKVTSVSTPEVDITKPGFYTIVYNVVDNDNNTDTATRVLLVNDGSYVVDPVNNLIIQAKGFEKFVSEVDTADAAIIEDGQVKVFDKTGVDVTAANTVTVDKGTYTNVAGKYNITFSVTDGPAITIEATVNAGEKPNLTVPAFTEININTPFNKMSGVSVTDIEDDDVELLGKVTSVSTPEVDITKPGFYTIVYSVMDNDNNTDTATRVLLVNDGSYVVDPVNNLIIQAKDFEKFVSEVDTADAAIIEDGQVKVFDKTGVDVTATNTVTVDKGTYTNVAGKYNITYTVTDGPAITIEATVNAGEKPDLTVPAFTEININTPFNKMSGVSVTDNEDDDVELLGKVTSVSTPEVDITKPGFYTIVYSVMDNDNNTDTATRVLLVNDGSYVVDPVNNLIIQAKGFEKFVSEVDTADAAIIEDGQVKVFDKTGVDVTAANTVTVDKGTYTNVAGKYNITFSVTDGPAITIEATVNAGEKPDLTVPAFTEINVNTPFNKISGVSVTDNEDDDVELLGKVTSVSTPEVDITKPGFYTIVYSVMDNDNNTDTATRVLLVNDGSYVVDPTSNLIIQAKDFEKFVREVDTADAAIIEDGQVKVFDKTGVDVTAANTVTVDKGTYTNVAGKYNITFSVTGGPAITIEATVNAGEKPDLTVPAFTEINVNTPFNKMSGVSVTDIEDDDVELLGKVTSVSTPEVDITKPGFYTIVYSVMDNDNNTDTATRVLLVNDGSYVVDPVNNLIIQAKGFEKFVSEVDTADAAIIEDGQVKVFNKTGVDVTAANTVTVDKGTYTNVAGKYNITYTVTGGPAITIEATVNAGEKPDLTVPAFSEITINSDFNKMSGVSVTDTEDDDTELLGKVTSVSTPEVDTTKPGFYTIVYNVVDNDNNTDTATRVVLVNDGSYVVDPVNNLIIQAQDFTKNVTEVDTADAAIIEAGQVKVFDKTGVDVTSVNTITVDKGTYTNAAGKYNITYSVVDGPSVTIKATVTVGAKPELIVPTFTEVTINSAFNEMNGVNVSDVEDDNAELLAKVVAISTPEFDITKPGFYTINYSVTDNDGNTDTATRVVLVNDGSYVLDPIRNIVIQAHDFEKYVSEVDTGDVAIKEAAQVKVFDKTGKDITTLKSVSINKGTYTNVEGTYDISFRVTGGPSITIKATVTAGDKPDLKVPAFTEISINTPFNTISGVSVTDTEDDDTELLGKVTAESTPVLDTSKPGFYSLNYSVTDNDGNNVTANRVVLVNDGSYVVDPINNLIIQAKDFTKYVTQVDLNDDAIKGAAQVKVFDKNGNDVTELNTVTVDKTTYTNVVGKYDITFEVLDGPSITIKATVTAGEKPDLIVPEFTEIAINTSFDNMSGVSVSDAEDDDAELFAKITIESTPEVDITTPGFYSVKYSVTDNDGNTSIATRVVLVNDGSYVVDPVNNLIIQAQDFEKYVSEVNTSDASIKEAAQVKVFDKKGIDITTTKTLIVNKGLYTNKEGKYDIAFSVKNGPSNIIKATVIAGEKPVLIVPTLTEITINSAFDIMSGVSVSDVEDDNTQLFAKINTVISPEINTKVAGVYTIKYYVTDNDGNRVMASQILVVNDGNIHETDSYFISYNPFTLNVKDVDTNPNSILANANVRIWDKKTGLELPLDIVIIDKNEYTNKVGVYDIGIRIKNDNSFYGYIKATVVDDSVVIEPVNPGITTKELPKTGSYTNYIINILILSATLLLTRRYIKNT